MLEIVTAVLARAGRPMPIREIHTAAEQLVDEPLLRTSVKAALAAGARHGRFRPLSRGLYEPQPETAD